MKNLLITYISFCFLFVPYLQAQEKEAEVKEIKEVEETQAVAEAPSQDVKDMKIKFGSKKHRSTIEETPGRIESTENILWKTCLSLAAVIAIILLIYSVLKKVNSKFVNIGSENPLRLNSKLIIDNKNYLALVRVYEEEILISVGPNGSTMLSKYALVDKEEAEGTDFESVLNKEGQAVVPMMTENHVSSIDLKTIKELKNNEN
ncbi:MAG: flagellar biosynthetic protein FliO [Lentisphaeraceae bacterium]|nr:flagellar biosynthetic protein FliO [Lentisphaeraceae bacterium]